jgi:hypothetical protein
MLTKSELTVKSARYQPKHSPGHYKGEFDLTCHIGPLVPELSSEAQWPMYSFDRPATILWNAIGAKLSEAGWSDTRIKEWLQSKHPRWALDGALGENIARLGEHWATEILAGRQ